MAKGVRAGWRNWCHSILWLVLCAGLVGLWASSAAATITEGDFSAFGFFESRESGRWGEGSATGPGTPTLFTPAPPGSIPVNQSIERLGTPPGESGGSFDFSHWDLVQMRQLAELRAQYHLVKNYKLFGRLDTQILRDAELFGFYRPWYDALGSIKDLGRAEPNRDWYPYDWRTIQQYYVRDDLHEYYVQLNFTDNFSARVGKQQIIWSEADALSGTEITNPSDLTYHWNNFETPEDLRKNLKMVKLNYLFPDFLKTADNLLELVWIAADWEGDYIIANGSDPRSPWVSYAALGPNPGYNQKGQPFRLQTFADQGARQLVPLLPNEPFFAQENVVTVGHPPSNSITDNSEFALRYSTLLPIGDGLQMSFIYLYEARMNRLELCTACGQQYGTIKGPLFIPGLGAIPPGARIHHVPFHLVAPGIWFGPGIYDSGPPKIGSVLGTTRVLLSEDYKRRNFFGLVGTYYDKDITNVVYRYDTLWAPAVGVGTADPETHSFALGTSSSAWTEYGRIILAADRPTYIPWLSKQHTFLTAQYVNTFYPDKPPNSDYYLFNFGGKLRRDDNLFFIGATDWLLDAQITTSNLYMWDIDDEVGFLESTNVYRYSHNVLFGINAIWFLGRSGRFTDPFLFSRDQRMNELEFTLTYEI
jgi:Protein of unknown function (DUF1302)